MSAPTNVQANDPANKRPSAEDERGGQIVMFVFPCLIGGSLTFVCSYNAHYAMVLADEAGFGALASFCAWRVACTAIILILQLVLFVMAAMYGMKWSRNITAVCGVNLVMVVLSEFIHLIMTRQQKEAIWASCAKRFNETDKLYHPYYPYAFFFWQSDKSRTEAEATDWCRSTWSSSIFWDFVLYVVAIGFTLLKIWNSRVLDAPQVDAGEVPATQPQGYSQLPQDVEAGVAPSAGSGEQLPPYKATPSS